MQRKQWIALGIFIAVIGLLISLLLRTDPAPPTPADQVHRSMPSGSQCLTCHGPGSAHYRGENHPPRMDCNSCHVPAE